MYANTVIETFFRGISFGKESVEFTRFWLRCHYHLMDCMKHHLTVCWFTKFPQNAYGPKGFTLYLLFTKRWNHLRLSNIAIFVHGNHYDEIGNISKSLLLFRTMWISSFSTPNASLHFCSSCTPNKNSVKNAVQSIRNCFLREKLNRCSWILPDNMWGVAFQCSEHNLWPGFQLAHSTDLLPIKLSFIFM